MSRAVVSALLVIVATATSCAKRVPATSSPVQTLSASRELAGATLAPLLVALERHKALIEADARENPASELGVCLGRMSSYDATIEVYADRVSVLFVPNHACAEPGSFVVGGGRLYEVSRGENPVVLSEAHD